MGGLMIFNAHPSLDWGKQSYSGTPSILVIDSKTDADGKLQGVTRVFGREFNTTGLLGVSRNANGEPIEVAKFARLAWHRQIHSRSPTLQASER